MKTQKNTLKFHSQSLVELNQDDLFTLYGGSNIISGDDVISILKTR